ncbi:MFS transporter [Saccharopolyspora spinosporotrichia]
MAHAAQVHPRGTRPGQHGPALTVRQALHHRAYQASLLSNFSNGWAVYGVRVALVPLFVVEALRSTQAMAGVALSVFAVGNAAVLMISGRISDQRGRKPMVFGGLTISALGSAALGFSDSVPWLLACSLIAGVGAGLLNPAQNAAVADVVGAKGKGGPVLATFQMAADVGAIPDRGRHRGRGVVPDGLRRHRPDQRARAAGAAARPRDEVRGEGVGPGERGGGGRHLDEGPEVPSTTRVAD